MGEGLGEGIYSISNSFQHPLQVLQHVVVQGIAVVILSVAKNLGIGLDCNTRVRFFASLRMTNRGRCPGGKWAARRESRAPIPRSALHILKADTT